MKHLSLLSAVACLSLCACQPPPIPPMEETLTYRDDLSVHPACNTNGLTYAAATIAGYTCAAKEYAFPDGVSEDTKKPIVLLFHGNSSSPADFETYSGDANATPMLSERLVAAGFKTYAVDFRYLTVDDSTTDNAAKNFDHAWATPIAEHFIESVMKANPGRKVSMVGFSLGTTIIRDALRRLAVKGGFDWSRVQDLVLAAGANHGVSTYRGLCPNNTPINTSMRAAVACQLGDRTAYTPTSFLANVNGEADAWDAPCSDGEHAFGVTSQCYGHKVQYTTIVMKDVSQGTYQDEFVSEASVHLEGADNQLLELTDNDLTNYFYNGYFKNHFGSIRSEHALTIAMNALSN